MHGVSYNQHLTLFGTFTLDASWSLTLYCTIPSFHNLQYEGIWKPFCKKEKMLVTSIFSFSDNVFFLNRTRIMRGSRYLSQGGSHRKRTRLIIWYFWFPDFSGCKPYTRKVNVSSSNHEVSTFWTLFRFMAVVYINAVQYQTCPNHESDNHFFAKIPGGGGFRTPGPPSGSALAYVHLSFNYANIHAISPMIYYFWYTTDIFRTKIDIPWIFLEHECTFCG